MTTIAVIGSGNIGGTLARKWAAAGHGVVLGTRDPGGSGARALADEIGARTATHADAVASAEVVLFALPGSAMAAVVAALSTTLDGKVAIDATNQVGAAVMSSIDAITERAPSAVPVRAFNSVGWEVFADPDFGGTAADLLWCGPDGHAGAIVEQLISDVGLRPVRVGGIDKLAIVDTLAGLWFALAFDQRLGRHTAFKILTRSPRP